MANNKIQIKRSSVPGRAPTALQLDVGEFAVNLVDNRLFTKDASNTVIDVLGQSLNTTANVSFTRVSAGNVVTSRVDANGSLLIDQSGASGNVTIRNNGFETVFTPTGTIEPAGSIVGGPFKSNQVDVTQTAPLALKGLVYGVDIVTSPDNGVTPHTWTFGTDGSLSTPGNITANGTVTADTFVGNIAWSYVTSKPDLKIDITGDATGNQTFTDLANGSINITLADTTVVAGTYGNSSVIPVITVDSKGRITSATTNAVAGITGYSYTSANNTFAITAGDGSVYKATINAVNTLSVSNTLTVTGVGTFSNDVNITGNLTVLGVTTFVNTTELNIGDNIITLNANAAGTPTLNAGIEVARGASLNVALLWNESDDRWTFTEDGINYHRIVGNTEFDLAILNVTTAAAEGAANAYSNAVATAAADATSKANAAYSNAVSHADTVAATAYSNATSYADTVAATAYSNATSYTDTKAAAAYTNAVSTAATDATNKAANAYSNAISYASDAASNAYANAVAYAASNTYVNSTFAKLSGASFTGAVDGITTFAAGNTTITGYVNTNIGWMVSNTTPGRFLTANSTGIFPSTNAAGYNLGDSTHRWWYFAATTGDFSGSVGVAGTLTVNGTSTFNANATFQQRAEFANTVLFSTTDGIGVRKITANHISNSSDLVLAPGGLAANGFIVEGFRGGFANTNLQIGNDGVATFANTIVAPTIFVGNSTVNATVNSTAFALNGVPIGGTAGAEAAYANAVAYADTVATTAYNNAVSVATALAGNAYANAIAYSGNAAAAYANAVAYTNGYAAANTYVNDQLALKANSASPTFAGATTIGGTATFTGNVYFTANTRIEANGSVGSTGQVLTSGGPGTNVYWSTVTTSNSVGTLYNLTTEANTLSANIILTGADSTIDDVKLIGSGGINVSSNGTVITIDGNSVIGGGGNAFGTIAVAGQSSLVAEQSNDTLTIVAGNNIVITTDASSDTITISSTASGGGGSGNNAGNAFIAGRDNYVGNGSTTSFTLSRNASANSILVLVEGLVQFHSEDYDVANTILTFVSAPANNEAVEVLHIAGASTYHLMQYGAIDSFTGDGSTTSYTMSIAANTSTAIVYVDGLLQNPAGDFTFSGTDLSFTDAPLAGETILVYHTDSISSALPGLAISSTDTFTGNGVDSTFTLSTTADITSSLVTINGIVQRYGVDYSITGLSLTFTDTPPSGAAISAMCFAGSVGTAYRTVAVGTSTISAESAASTLTLANTAGITLGVSGSTVTIGTSAIAKQSLTGNGSNTEFTLTYSATADDIFVYVNGIYFHPDEDYTVSGTTLTFTEAPVDTSQIRIRYMRAPEGLIALIGDLGTGSGSYDMNSEGGPGVDLNA